jgi:F-type H+-transporting ATPase subunit b
MDLVTPGIGMIFWSTLFFLVLLFILGKFAWPAILTAVKARNESIRHALDAADKAKKEMAKLQADNQKILAEAKAERDKLIADAREKAGEEAKKLVQNAREAIQSEKAAALNDMKVQIAGLSVEIAEKLLRTKLEESKAQKELVDKLINEADLN